MRPPLTSLAGRARRPGTTPGGRGVLARCLSLLVACAAGAFLCLRSGAAGPLLPSSQDPAPGFVLGRPFASVRPLAGGASAGGSQDPSRAPERALLVAREGKKKKPPKSEFLRSGAVRGTTRRGKKGHFHLLDKYIRRIDALVPEEMEHLVRPLSYRPNDEQNTHTLKITFNETETADSLEDVQAAADAITEEEVRDFFSPLELEGVTLGYRSFTTGFPHVYVRFESNDMCQVGRQRNEAMLGGLTTKVRYVADHTWDEVLRKLERRKAEKEDAVLAEQSTSLQEH